MFLVLVILSSQSLTVAQQSVSLDLTSKSFSQDVLNAMEKTGFLAQIAGGRESSGNVETYLSQLMPVNKNAQFSLVEYEFKDGGFEVKRIVNASTGSFYAPFSITRRVVFIPGKGGDRYAIAELRVGYK